MHQRNEAVSLAAAVLGIEPENRRRTALVGESQGYVLQQVLQPMGRMGVGKEYVGFLILIRCPPVDDLG